MRKNSNIPITFFQKSEIFLAFHQYFYAWLLQADSNLHLLRHSNQHLQTKSAKSILLFTCCTFFNTVTAAIAQQVKSRVSDRKVPVQIWFDLLCPWERQLVLFSHWSQVVYIPASVMKNLLAEPKKERSALVWLEISDRSIALCIQSQEQTNEYNKEVNIAKPRKILFFMNFWGTNKSK